MFGQGTRYKLQATHTLTHTDTHREARAGLVRVRPYLNDDPAERLVVDGHVEEATGQTHLAGKVARLLRRSGTEYGSDTTTAIIDSRTGPLRGDTE